MYMRLRVGRKTADIIRRYKRQEPGVRVPKFRARTGFGVKAVKGSEHRDLGV